MIIALPAEGVTGRSLSDVLPLHGLRNYVQPRLVFPHSLRNCAKADPSFTPREDTPIRAGTGAQGEGWDAPGMPGATDQGEMGKNGETRGDGRPEGGTLERSTAPENRCLNGLQEPRGSEMYGSCRRGIRGEDAGEQFAPV